MQVPETDVRWRIGHINDMPRMYVENVEYRPNRFENRRLQLKVFDNLPNACPTSSVSVLYRATGFCGFICHLTLPT